MKRKKIKVAFVSIFLSIGSMIYGGCQINRYDESNEHDSLVFSHFRPSPPLTDKAYIAQYVYARPSMVYDFQGISDNITPIVMGFDLCLGCNTYFGYKPTPVGEAKHKEYVVSFENRVIEWDALRKYHKDTVNIPGIEQFFGIVVADTLDYIHITADRKYVESHTANPYYMNDIVTVFVNSAGRVLREYHTFGKYTGTWGAQHSFKISDFNKLDNIHKNLLSTKMYFHFKELPYRTDTFQFSFHWRYKNGTEYKTTSPRLIIIR